MLEKYLNKQVIVEEKLYNHSSTAYSSSGFAKSLSMGVTNSIEGTLTDIDDDFVELDNNSLILKKHIYRIILN